MTLFFIELINGCSDFLLNSTSNVLSGRSMDFIVDLHTTMEVVPIESKFIELTGHIWYNRYGFVSFNVENVPFAVDGLNTKGLSAAWLYLEGTKYPEYDVNDKRPAISNLCSYILGNYASIEQVIAGIKNIQPVGLDLSVLPQAQEAGWGPLKYLPMHLALHDAFGKSFVIEFLNGQTFVFDNPLGVLTNAPSLQQQLERLSTASPDMSYSSTDRFQRLVRLNAAFNQDEFDTDTITISSDNAQNGVTRALHLLNSVVQPLVAPSFASEWVLVRDHERKQLYVQSTQTSVLRRIALNQLEFTKGAIPMSWRLDHTVWFIDMENTSLHSIEKRY
ncbi:cysteine protease family C59 [Thraustotheca clavata]|uniref:Cysteine protease family C59 n=1 Tax=Thraustotheca clavata TaxID=74557 RepID=A0A1V9YVW1_9STRA|nr:cysteine protease family C59 [Thraustotheca clavata]